MSTSITIDSVYPSEKYRIRCLERIYGTNEWYAATQVFSFTYLHNLYFQNIVSICVPIKQIEGIFRTITTGIPHLYLQPYISVETLGFTAITCLDKSLIRRGGYLTPCQYRLMRARSDAPGLALNITVKLLRGCDLLKHSISHETLNRQSQNVWFILLGCILT